MSREHFPECLKYFVIFFLGEGGWGVQLTGREHAYLAPSPELGLQHKEKKEKERKGKGKEKEKL